jgi:hypothetical protein
MNYVLIVASLSLAAVPAVAALASLARLRRCAADLETTRADLKQARRDHAIAKGELRRSLRLLHSARGRVALLETTCAAHRIELERLRSRADGPDLLPLR